MARNALLIDLSDDSRLLVLNFTVTAFTHPLKGSRAAAGNLKWNDKALTQAAKAKWIKHGRQYAVLGFAFAPCVTTTYGRIDANFLRLLSILATKQAELVHVHQRPHTYIHTYIQVGYDSCT
jgi:hypothetical protein